MIRLMGHCLKENGLEVVFFYLYDHPGLTQTLFPTGKQKPLVTPPTDPLLGLSLRVCVCMSAKCLTRADHLTTV